MTTWAVLASGPSMSQEVADMCRGRVKTVAISDSYRLAPWADCLVSADTRWWRNHPKALDVPSEKFSSGAAWQAVPGVTGLPEFGTYLNSGLLGCYVALTRGATRLLLCGFDFRPGHFFGQHPAPMRNTTPDRFEVFQKQFAAFKPRGVEVFNCTPNSGLRAFPMRDLHACLAEFAS